MTTWGWRGTAVAIVAGTAGLVLMLLHREAPQAAAVPAALTPKVEMPSPEVVRSIARAAVRGEEMHEAARARRRGKTPSEAEDDDEHE